MADKRLQTVKFPGIDNTYIIPTVDTSLTVEGAAADSKTVGERLDALDVAIAVDETGNGDIYIGSYVSGEEGEDGSGSSLTQHLLDYANPHKVTAAQVGADAEGSAAAALTQAKAYTDSEIAELINSAPTTLDTLGEIAAAMEANEDVVTALENAIGTKATASDLTAHIGDKNNPHGVTIAQIGAAPAYTSHWKNLSTAGWYKVGTIKPISLDFTTAGRLSTGGNYSYTNQPAAIIDVVTDYDTINAIVTVPATKNTGITKVGFIKSADKTFDVYAYYNHNQTNSLFFSADMLRGTFEKVNFESASVSESNMQSVVTVNQSSFAFANHTHTLTNLSGTLSVAKGGTGAATAKAAAYNLLNDMSDSTIALTDDSKFVFKLATTASAENGALMTKSASVVWDYIKGKADQYYYSDSVSRTANTVLAAPNGSNGAATFRALVAADIPSLSASKITSGTLPIERGGTGATTARAASYYLLKDMNDTTATAITDTSKFTFTYSSPSTTNGAIFCKSATAVWDYIKGKANSTYAPVSHTHNYAGSSSAGGAANYAKYLEMNDCNNKDFNTIKTAGFYYGYTGMTNAAAQGISVLEVIVYSSDWVVQRQTLINATGSNRTYERHYYSGSTWSTWKTNYDSGNIIYSSTQPSGATGKIWLQPV